MRDMVRKFAVRWKDKYIAFFDDKESAEWYRRLCEVLNNLKFEVVEVEVKEVLENARD